MKILIACEFSGVVRDAFIAKGHDAISCDLLPTVSPGPHIQDNVLNHLKGWDLIIAHPPCTYLGVASYVHIHRAGRKEKREEASQFWMSIARAPCDRIAIENPPGYMIQHWRNADQFIQPYQFGHPVHKKTGLWLKGLPKLTVTSVVKPTDCWFDGRRFRYWVDSVTTKDRASVRAVTFAGIAQAMADQWGN